MAFDWFFLIGLALLVLGNGAFKPTISAQLSQLYDQPEIAALRDGGFALYYMAINLGALLAPLACGYLQSLVSYHAGFGAAGVGMVIGLLTYVTQSHHLPQEHCASITAPGLKAHPSDVQLSGKALYRRDAKEGPDSPLERGASSAFGGEPASPPGTSSKGGAPLGSKMEVRWPADGRWPARRMFALTAICALVLPYWVCWEQMANMVPIYYETSVERSVLGRPVPAAALQCISPIFTVFLLPFFSARWARQAKSGTEQSTAAKLAIGATFNGLGWLVFAGTADATHIYDPLHGQHKTTLWWPIFANLLYTIGHIHIGPVGLSLATRCAPPGSQSLAVGLWFLFGGCSGPLAGKVGALYALWTPAWFFSTLAAIALANAFLLLAFTGGLEKIARGHEH